MLYSLFNRKDDFFHVVAHGILVDFLDAVPRIVEESKCGVAVLVLLCANLTVKIVKNLLELSKIDILVLLDLNIFALFLKSFKNLHDVYDILVSAI